MPVRTDARTTSSAGPQATAGDPLGDALRDPLIPAGPLQRDVTEAGPGLDSRGIVPSGSSSGKGSGSGSGHKNDGRKEIGANKRDLVLDGTTGSGSAMVVAGARTESTVNDYLSLTSAYHGLKQEHPDWTDDELWAEAARTDYNPGGEVLAARQKSKPAPAPSGGSERAYDYALPPIDNTYHVRAPVMERKFAWVIGNEKYPGRIWSDLPNAKVDAKAMQADLSGEGYQVTRVEDVNSSQIKVGFNVFPNKALPGDDIVLYYAGHGLPDGLAGADSDHVTGKGFTDVFKHAELGKIAAKAVSKGFHVKIIVDACHSAGAAHATSAALHEGVVQSHTTELIQDFDEAEKQGLPNRNGRAKVTDLKTKLGDRYDVNEDPYK